MRYSTSPDVAHKFNKGTDAEALFITANGSGNYCEPHTWEVVLVAKDIITAERAIGIAILKVEKMIQIDRGYSEEVIEVDVAKMAKPVSTATLDKGTVYRVNLTSRQIWV